MIVLPPHGIQLETHRGLPSLCLTASRRFIPLAALENFVINEGLRRWDVRYYLAAIKQSGTEDFTLEVAYTVGSFFSRQVLMFSISALEPPSPFPGTS